MDCKVVPLYISSRQPTYRLFTKEKGLEKAVVACIAPNEALSKAVPPTLVDGKRISNSGIFVMLAPLPKNMSVLIVMLSLPLPKLTY